MIFKENRFYVSSRLGRTVTNITWIMICTYIPLAFSGVLTNWYLPFIPLLFQSMSYFVIIPKIINKNFKDSV